MGTAQNTKDTTRRRDKIRGIRALTIAMRIVERMPMRQRMMGLPMHVATGGAILSAFMSIFMSGK